MSDRLRWDVDGRDWPNRAFSRFVEAGGLKWHVQVMGRGPALLLAHGTGASTHSWRGLAPLLASRFTVLSPDLPGHGFTDPPKDGSYTLPFMAEALAALVAAFSLKPAVVVGHSAGAAILLRMCLDGRIDPRLVVSLNGALQPFGGGASTFFSPLARLLFMNPITPRLFAWRAENRAAVERVIEGTGSNIDEEGIALYQRLFQSPDHCAAALGMMAAWDLDPLIRDLPRLRPKLVLVAGGSDRAIPPSVAQRVRSIVPGSRVEYLRGLGHLAHEERPQDIVDLILRVAAESGVEAGQ